MRICIDGNIGASKSTVIESIRRLTGLSVVPEPVDEFKELLGLMYADMTRWAFTFNMNIILQFSRQHAPRRSTVYERSCMSCRHVFVENQFDSGFMTKIERDIIAQTYNDHAWVPDVVIYVRTSPEVCHSRMRSRSREGEEGVTLSYIMDLHAKYEKMMNRLAMSEKVDAVRVFRVNGDNDRKQVCDDVMAIIERLELTM